jgi:hypothetical protein
MALSRLLPTLMQFTVLVVLLIMNKITLIAVSKVFLSGGNTDGVGSFVHDVLLDAQVHVLAILLSAPIL